jgi:spermidine synthase
VVDRHLKPIIYSCFFISGAAGLIYEVVWARQLSLFLGITTFANTAVITAYMAGLAAGSLVIGSLADRQKDSLRFYAWLEVGVGLYAATTPWLFSGIQTAYAGATGSLGITGALAHLLRFTLALAALLVPTFLMGGTLPLLVRGLTGSLPELAASTGRLYGINTLGAAAGTFAAGYLLLPTLGVRNTNFLRGTHESGRGGRRTGFAASFPPC